MADMTTTQRKPQKGCQRKPLSTRVDLTPMVDLGFLLITFFIFTTTLNEAKATNLVVPADDATTEPPLVSEEKTLQIFPAGNNTLFYCFGNAITAMKATNYSPAGIRKVIQEKQAQLAAKNKANSLVVLIKPTPTATYGNTVAIIDEMLINAVTRYMLTDPTPIELATLKQ